MIKDLSLGFRYLIVGCDIKNNPKRKTTTCSLTLVPQRCMYVCVCCVCVCVCVVYVLNRPRTKLALLESLRYFIHWECNTPYTRLSSMLIRIFSAVTGCEYKHSMCHCPRKWKVGTLGGGPESGTCSWRISWSVFLFPPPTLLSPMSSLQVLSLLYKTTPKNGRGARNGMSVRRSCGGRRIGFFPPPPPVLCYTGGRCGKGMRENSGPEGRPVFKSRLWCLIANQSSSHFFSPQL